MGSRVWGSLFELFAFFAVKFFPTAPKGTP
jgi:hypothetical protein